jgi:hypothetical protein
LGLGGAAFRGSTSSEEE